MKFTLPIILCLVLNTSLYAQRDREPVKLKLENDTLKVVDDRYREDQFYISITYNLLGNKPEGVEQSGFSTGYHLGFIRDMPLNRRRNLALGLGLGVSSNSYNNTLLISESNAEYIYSVIDERDIDYDKNKFTNYLIEVPFEFRWRTSTATDYNFWRIYTGFKMGYIVYNSSKFESASGDIRLSQIDDINRIQYGLTLSVGYANISFHVYYALNNVFDASALVESTGEPVDMNAIKIGLMFYIL